MPENKIKTIFIGTPDFGVPALESLIKDELFNVVCVISQPDKKIGRKQILTPPPIKIIALKNKIPVLQPDKIIQSLEKIKSYNADLIIVAAYAQIIPKKILDIAKFGCINIHGSLLPKYRGSACVQAPLLDGEEETGITVMKMDKGLDTGPIIAQERIKIHTCDTAETIFDKLSILGGEFLVPTLKKYINKEIIPVKQDDQQASYVKQLQKNDGHINWLKTGEEIERHIRAMYSWPGTYILVDNKIIKILPPVSLIDINKHKPGELFIHENKLAIQCGKNSLLINRLQPAGKKEMTSEEFLLGHKNYIGLLAN